MHGGRNFSGIVGSGGTSSGLSGFTRCGVTSTINSVRSWFVALALEQLPDDWEAAQQRDRLLRVLRDVVQQSGDREGLPVAQLDVGLGAARDERRHPEAPDRDAVRKVERADFRL